MQYLVQHEVLVMLSDEYSLFYPASWSIFILYYFTLAWFLLCSWFLLVGFLLLYLGPLCVGVRRGVFEVCEERGV